ncbi:MAG: hypothetical protein U0232_16830 [Thermomicrobiales bacterium]
MASLSGAVAVQRSAAGSDLGDGLPGGVVVVAPQHEHAAVAQEGVARVAALTAIMLAARDQRLVAGS